MKFKKIIGLSIASLAMISVASCGGPKPGSSSTSVENSTTSVTSTPTSAPTSTPTSTPTSVPTSTPTSTPTSAPTSKPTSTPTSTPTGPIENGSSEGSLDSGNGEVVSQKDVVITSCSGTNEAAYVEYAKVPNATGYAVYFKTANDSAYAKADSNIAFTQYLSDNKVRTDLVGLKPGSYNVKIVPIINDSEQAERESIVLVNVVAYDRSGYAHFNYTDGVGAYKDDGTLKDNAIVLYVTDSNKNTVTLTYGDTTVTGIGNILNSAGQECGEVGHEGQCKKVSGGKTYYATANGNKGIIKTLAENDIPLVIRIVGTVSESGLGAPGTFNANSEGLIDGLTAYNGNDYGGTAGDNGHMARMKSGKNITIEGIGNDAAIDGWGIHFMCESAAPQYAKNFEVRNITFMNNPEDALGMEGVQANNQITASVERCWIHHNSFLKPTITSAAESDKSEGDGSCDFKRGRYFTNSYNYYENCHKTNLMGSSDDSLQFHLSFHHNLWYGCMARQPLVRNSNVHFYNNYIVGTTDYVASVRANAYLYTENNYYLGCKNAVQTTSGGTAKSYGDIMVGGYEDNMATIATSREQSISSSNLYANFDTNPEIFYYDSVNKVSDCYLTDANTARKECLLYSGSPYRTVLNKTELKTTLDITSIASSATVGATDTLSVAKAKGIVKVFTLTAPASVTISATGTAGYSPAFLVKKDGTFICAITSTAQKVEGLEPGEYVIISGAYDPVSGKNSKEASAELIFEEFNLEELDNKLIAAYNDAVNAIPEEITFSTTCYNAIKNAEAAYKALGSRLQPSVDYSKLTTKVSAYKAACVTKVEALINAIGTVNENSGAAITQARTAYDTLLSQYSDVTVSNYNTLTQAEDSFKEYAVTAAINAINAIGTVDLTKGDLITTARNLYDTLTTEDKALVTNYNTLTQAEAKYSDLVKIDNVNTLINNCDTTSLESINEALNAYNALTDTLKLEIDSAKVSSLKVKQVELLIAAIPETIEFTAKASIDAANNAYNLLTDLEKASVTNVAKLTKALEDYEALGIQTLESLEVTTGFDTYFEVTGDPSSISASHSYELKSLLMFDNLSSISITSSVTDKGATSIKVYYSTDGNSWTDCGTEFKPSSNNSAATVTASLNVTGPVYIKIVVTCSKPDTNPKAATVSAIKVNKEN